MRSFSIVLKGRIVVGIHNMLTKENTVAMSR